MLAHTTVEEASALATEFKKLDLVCVSGVADEPVFRLEQVPGTKTQLVQTGGKGMFCGVVGVFANEQQRFRYQRVPLDSRFEDSPEMLQLLRFYQSILKKEGLAQLGLKPIPHPTEREFVGSEKCGDCHTQAFDVWTESPHYHATESLVNPPNSRGDIPRHYDPECLSCHVTGWNPQQFFPYRTGFLSLEETPEMFGNGCENCHGPGASHVAAEEDGAPEAELKLRRREMVLQLSKAEQRCLECHDIDNDPHFHHEGAFEEYWEQIEHYGKD